MGVVFFLLASFLYKPPPDSTHSSYASTDRSTTDANKASVKDPEDNATVDHHAR